LVPAAADLDGERARDRLAKRAEDDAGAQRVAHQRRALSLGDDLCYRAAHVEIDAVGAVGLESPRRVREDVGILAEQLQSGGTLAGQIRGTRERAGVLTHKRAGGALPARQAAGAPLARDEPKRRIGAAAQGGQTQIEAAPPAILARGCG